MLNKKHEIKQIITEIKHIKRVVPEEKLAKLNYSKFNGCYVGECIYGQLYGSTFYIGAMCLKKDFILKGRLSHLEYFLYEVEEFGFCDPDARKVARHIFDFLQGRVKNLNFRYYLKSYNYGI